MEKVLMLVGLRGWGGKMSDRGGIGTSAMMVSALLFNRTGVPNTTRQSQSSYSSRAQYYSPETWGAPFP